MEHYYGIRHGKMFLCPTQKSVSVSLFCVYRTLFLCASYQWRNFYGIRHGNLFLCQLFFLVPKNWVLYIIAVARPNCGMSPFLFLKLSFAILIGLVIIFPIWGRMSAPSNTNNALVQINRDERIVFDHWKQTNDQLRLLRFELNCIPIDDPRRVEISKLIENLKSTKKKYNDTLQIPSYYLVTNPATVILHSPPMPSETMQHCNSLDSTLHQPLCSNYMRTPFWQIWWTLIIRPYYVNWTIMWKNCLVIGKGK